MFATLSLGLFSIYFSMIFQPIEEPFQPTALQKTEISFNQFIELLEQEENYFTGEQHFTKLMITRLRKIFYDIYGWNSELIRGAAKIKGRYEVKLVPDAGNSKNEGLKTTHMVRKVLVKKGDWMNPNAGAEPEIFTDNHQTVTLPSGLTCDMGHVLAGMDAFNYPAPVTPLPRWLFFLKRFFPLVDSNMDIVTWLGDIASSAGEFLFKHMDTKKPLSDADLQSIIEEMAPASDMLGDIDPYIICQVYGTNASCGFRVTEIFKDYYSDDGLGAFYRKRRCQIFCKLVGLKNWDGEKFGNEEEWINYYLKQLRNNDAFYIFSRCENLKGVLLALMTWMRGYKKTLRDRFLLQLFLKTLKSDIKLEPQLSS
jgi:hypothetical protein